MSMGLFLQFAIEFHDDLVALVVYNTLYVFL